MQSVVYAECRKHGHHAECHYAECRYAECRKHAHYAECPYAECRDAECRGAATRASAINVFNLRNSLKSYRVCLS